MSPDARAALRARLDQVTAHREELWSTGAPPEAFEGPNAERDWLAEQLMDDDVRNSAQNIADMIGATEYLHGTD